MQNNEYIIQYVRRYIKILMVKLRAMKLTDNYYFYFIGTIKIICKEHI